MATVWRTLLLLLASDALTFATRVVVTSNGPIVGHPAPAASAVTEFLGIPYALPPVGELRFASPVRHNRRQVQVASDWGFDCPQTPSPPRQYPGLTPQANRIISLFAASAGTQTSEDCLTLNVWTPSASVGYPTLKPVLVFFYGGRFTIGNTNSPFYNGKRLAQAEDVVVITLNYRINIFGFPGAPNEPQNLGLRDQRLALEWIRDNCVSFGGDARRITIFGQSSGGVSVDFWSYAYREDPIVAGLISESGNAFSFPANSPDTVERAWYNVSSTVGCGGSGDTIECMREKDWKDIEAAAASVPSSPGGSVFRAIPAFWPTVDNLTVFGNYSSLASEGKFARLPYLLGNNNYEQGFYDLSARARGTFTTRAQGDEFLLSSFTCPNSYEARQRRAYGVPVWQYRYFGDWDNLRLYPNSSSYHGTELEMVFGNSAEVSGLPNSEAEDQTIRLMQRAWATFARDPACGLDELGWPEFDPKTKSLVRLAFDNEPKATFVRPGVYDAACRNVTLAAEQ